MEVREKSCRNKGVQGCTCGRDVLEATRENVDPAFWNDRLERSPPREQT